MASRTFTEISLELSSRLRDVKALTKGRDYQHADELFEEAEELLARLNGASDSANPVQQTIAGHRAADLRSLKYQIREGLDKREQGKTGDGNIAFKCNWNDRGYRDLCSQAAYDHNMRMDREWCRVDRCHEAAAAGRSGPEVCYEAAAMLNWTFATGWDHDEHGKQVKARKILSARTGRVALLTTTRPGSRDRLLLAAFKIERLVDDWSKETVLYGDPATAIGDMLDYDINFWEHYRNPDSSTSRQWGTGLFRYVSNEVAHGVLNEYQ